ncbi:MAG: PIN domain-containing protein [Syntrophomonadaceae bacterium]|nr:PIN domain-containing protein [Syntrophomonadaceae bacterium]
MKGNVERQFVDTNILIYAHDVTAGVKHEKARDLLKSLWETGLGCLSIQVLQEFYVTVVQKVARPLQPDMASQIICDLSQWRIHMPRVGDILEAIEIHQRNKLSFWDAMIVCSARKLDCGVIWTEDLNEGQVYEGVKALSPFS